MDVFFLESVEQACGAVSSCKKEDVHTYLGHRRALLTLKMRKKPNAISSRRSNYAAHRYHIAKLKEIRRKKKAESTSGTEDPSEASSKEEPPKEVRIELQEIERGPESELVNDAYSFTGMHHIWCEHDVPVTNVRFANDDASLIAFAAMDGAISVCLSLPEPKLKYKFSEHEAAVTDLSWSMSNDMLLSCSEDGTACVWNVEDGTLIRKVVFDSACQCCAFMPLNSNIFFVGTEAGSINILNLSTGQCLHQEKLKSQPFCLTFDPCGDYVFIGDISGTIHAFFFDLSTMKTRLSSKQTVSSQAITSISYKFISKAAGGHPRVLVTCQDSTMKLFGVAYNGNIAKLNKEREFYTRCKKMRIRSCFCPLISQRDGACLVGGSEDMKVRLYDLVGGKCVNELQGHSAAVTDVSWNYDETLLASCDLTGMVILWKRVFIKEGEVKL